MFSTLASRKRRPQPIPAEAKTSHDTRPYTLASLETFSQPPYRIELNPLDPRKDPIGNSPQSNRSSPISPMLHSTARDPRKGPEELHTDLQTNLLTICLRSSRTHTDYPRTTTITHLAMREKIEFREWLSLEGPTFVTSTTGRLCSKPIS